MDPAQQAGGGTQRLMIGYAYLLRSNKRQSFVGFFARITHPPRQGQSLVPIEFVRAPWPRAFAGLCIRERARRCRRPKTRAREPPASRPDQFGPARALLLW